MDGELSTARRSIAMRRLIDSLPRRLRSLISPHPDPTTVLGAALLALGMLAIGAIILTAREPHVMAGADLSSAEQAIFLLALLATLVILALPVAALIGERDRLRVAAEHSARLFRRIARATPAGILHIEHGGDVTFANDRWVELTGVRPASFTGESWLDMIHPADRAAATAMWDRARSLHQPAGGDLCYLAPAGAVRWAELSFYPEIVGDRLLGHVVKLFDVSHRHDAEQALQKSEELYRLLAENSSDVIVRLTLDGTARYVSNAASRLFGFEPADLVERPLARFIHPDDLDAFRTLFPGANNDCGETSAQFRHRRRCGDFVWLEASARTTVDPATGEPLEITASLRDFSERRRIETIAAEASAKLRESHRLLTLAEGLAHVGHWRFDVASRAFDCSPEVNIITGIPRGQPIGPAEILALVHPADRRGLLRTLVTASRQPPA